MIFGVEARRPELCPYFPMSQALHEIAGGLHVDLKPQQLLVDERGRLKLNDFNSAHIMSINPLDGTYCPVQATKRNRLTPWPSPENYAGEVKLFPQILAEPRSNIPRNNETLALFLVDCGKGSAAIQTPLHTLR